MLELDVRTFAFMDRDRANNLIAECLEAGKSGQFLKASETFVKAVGVTCVAKNEEYYQDALYYQLGLLAAHLGEPERANEFMTNSNTLPGHGGEPPFEDHQRISIALANRQATAIKRGIPAIILASMPRAASASFTQTIGEHFDIPVMRVSVGDHPNAYLMTPWLIRFLFGGAVLHDHFGANEHNLAVMKDAQIRDLFVLIRDPRAAANSFVNMSGIPDERYEDFQWRQFLQQNRWLREWAEADASDPSLNVHWITSQEAMNDPNVIIDRMQPVFGIPTQGPRKVEIVSANFVTGSDDAWRKRCGDDLRQRMWAEIPLSIKSRLRLSE